MGNFYSTLELMITSIYIGMQTLKVQKGPKKMGSKINT